MTSASPVAASYGSAGTPGGGNAAASGGSSIARGGATRSPDGVRRSRSPNFTGEMRESHRPYCTITQSFRP